jgi:hypothetical protein
MRFPNWVCSDCGRPFGRRWNGQRHIQLCHYGFGSLVSFIDYLSGRQSGFYPSSSPPSYGRRSTSFLDIYTDEFNRALARESVNRFFHPPQPGMKYNFNNIGNQLGHNRHHPEDSEKIFGIRAHACEKCLTTEALKVYFVDNQNKNVARREETHICNPQWVEEAQQLTNRDIYAKDAYGKLPGYLKTVIKGWTKNKAYLIAIELPHSPPDNSIKIMQKVNPPNSITLQYSREQIIELSPSPPNYQNDWTTRAIKNKLTTLNDEEIEDFCQKVKDATFAFFKVKTEEVSTHFYLMAIAKNNNNNANDNNIQSTHSLDDEQRNPKTLPN